MEERTDVVSQAIEEDQSEGVFDAPFIGGTEVVTEEALNDPFTGATEVESKEALDDPFTGATEVVTEGAQGPKCPPCLCSDAATEFSYWTHSHLSVIEVYL